jgi:hypothetical protein
MAEASELPDHFRSAPLLRLFGDGGAAFFVTDSLVQDQVVLGYYQYHAVPGNSTQLRIFRRRVCWVWRSVLVRRSQRAQVRWERLSPLLIRWIPQPRILHPYPDARFAATHPG